MPIASVNSAAAVAATTLTSDQKAALKHLHLAAQQFESVFVSMLFKSMRATAPLTSISGGKPSPAESTFSEMLDQKRADSIAETGSFGIAKILEDQLKASVLANPAQAAKARISPPSVL